MPLVNFYSNIWIYYNIDLNKDKFLTNISKIKLLHNIKKIINLDSEFMFWDFNENIFNDLIATQVILDKKSKCLFQLKKHSKLLETYIINNTQILIITYSKIQILVTLLIFFLNKKGNIKLKNGIITINSKLPLGHNFKLNDNLKSLLLSECNN